MIGIRLEDIAEEDRKKVTTPSFSVDKASKWICSGVFASLIGSHSMNRNSDLHVKGQGLVSVLDMKNKPKLVVHMQQRYNRTQRVRSRFRLVKIKMAIAPLII
jgi:hypothetical protein